MKEKNYPFLNSNFSAIINESKKKWIFSCVILFLTIFIFLSRISNFHSGTKEILNNNDQYSLSNILLPGESLFVVQTKTIPSFLQVLPNPYEDGRNTQHLALKGSLHPKFTVLLRKLMNQNCLNKDGTPKLFIDCGSNVGYFSLFAASLGCSVVAIEGNPFLASVMDKSIRFNGFEKKITFYPRVVSDKPSGSIETFAVYSNHYGLSYVKSKDNPNYNIDEGATQEVQVSTIQIDDIVQQDVFIMKIDVEGYELKALHSAKNLVSQFTIQHIFIEWDKIKGQAAGTQILTHFSQKLNYDIFCLPYESYDDAIENWDVIWEKDSILLSEFGDIQCSDLWLRKKAS
jgi:FkbM family methyltransferase